jgi:hypothetical protein
MGDSMPQWMQDLFTGWPMIRANLPTFFVVVVLIFGAVWWLMDWRYGAIVASKTGQIELQDRQLADYKQKLDGASPDQAKAKIEALEHTIRATIGSKWEPLSKAQISALALKLKGIEKSRATVMYENTLGKQLAQNIFDAFQEAGWTEAKLMTGSGFGEGIVVGWSSRAVAIGNVLETTAKLNGVWAKDTEKEIRDLVIVGVGINSD